MKDELKKVIGSRLKLLRVENGDTMKELSEKANISITTIWRCENGMHDITMSNITKILNCYDVDISIFFQEVSAKMHEREG